MGLAVIVKTASPYTPKQPVQLTQISAAPRGKLCIFDEPKMLFERLKALPGICEQSSLLDLACVPHPFHNHMLPR